MENDSYLEFLENKQKIIIQSGFDISEKEINDTLFDFQKFVDKKAIKAGRYAIFAGTGLGKTIMQCEIAYQVVKKENIKALILAPLAVTGQTIKEAKEKLNIDIGNEHNIHINNYDQLKNINENDHDCIILDESSILKNFTGQTKKELIKKFENTKYKFCFSATPSPNDETELLNTAEFLGINTRLEVLANYFVHDGGETSKWRLKKHAEDDFYGWVQSWAIMFQNPEDIGFDGSRFKLPKLNKYLEIVKVPRKINGNLGLNNIVSATEFNKELRNTMDLRAEKVLEIIKKIPKNEQILIWCNQDKEADLLKELLFDYDYKEVRGSQKPELKEKLLLDFANKKYRILITKTKIAGMGMNFQNCFNTIYFSIDFSFEKLYQSIRRFWRFGQKHAVNVWIVAADTMGNVLKSLERKEKAFLKMQKKMIEKLNYKKELKMIKNIENKKGKNFELYKGDTFQLIKEIESESIGLSVFSPPFPELYVYSDNIEDMNNCNNMDQFFEQFEYMIPELKRIMIKGRIVAIHCMDIPIQKQKHGYIGLRDFPGDIVKLFEKYGFIYHSKMSIWKDPVIEMQRTKALGLLHKQLKKDSIMSRVGLPDYIVAMRLPDENEKPVSCDLVIPDWQVVASPAPKPDETILWDIDYGNTLNRKNAKDKNDEKHITPLQLETIRRCIKLWSNENEIVFDPFMGIGSTAHEALLMNRKAIGIELKKSYYDLSVKYMMDLEKFLERKTLLKKES